MVGLDELAVVNIFKRHFGDLTITDTMINSISKAVGEIIAENNRRIEKELKASNTQKARW